jgi:hypothetical protein
LSLADWDLTIERAQREPHVEEKLLHTVHRLNSARQRSRLRGDAHQATALDLRLGLVRELIDRL